MTNHNKHQQGQLQKRRRRRRQNCYDSCDDRRRYHQQHEDENQHNQQRLYNRTIKMVHYNMVSSVVILITISIIIQHQCFVLVMGEESINLATTLLRGSTIVSAKAIVPRRRHDGPISNTRSLTSVISSQEQQQRQLQQRQLQQQHRKYQQQQIRRRLQDDEAAAVAAEQQCREQLVQADTDGDGKLVLDEFTYYIQTSLVPTLINRAMAQTIIPDLFTSLTCCSPQKLYLIQYFSTPLDDKENQLQAKSSSSLSSSSSKEANDTTSIVDVRKCCTFPNNKQLILDNSTDNSSSRSNNSTTSTFINLYLNSNENSVDYYIPPEKLTITDYYLLQSEWQTGNNDNGGNVNPVYKSSITTKADTTDTTDYLSRLCQGIDQYFVTTGSETDDGSIPTNPTTPSTDNNDNGNGNTGNDDSPNNNISTPRPVVVTKSPSINPPSLQTIQPTQSPSRRIRTTSIPSSQQQSTRVNTGSPITSSIATEVPISNIIDTKTKIPSPDTTTNPTISRVTTTSSPHTNSNNNLNSKNPSPSDTNDDPTDTNDPDPAPPTSEDDNDGGNDSTNKDADRSMKKAMLIIVIVVGTCILLVLVSYFGYLEYQRQQQNKILRSSALRRFHVGDNQSITQSADNSITQYHDIDPLFVTTGLAPPTTTSTDNNDTNNDPTSNHNDKITQSIADIISSSQSNQTTTVLNYAILPGIGESFPAMTSMLLSSPKEQQQQPIDDEAEADIKTLFAGSVHDNKIQGGGSGSSSHNGGDHSSTSSIYIIQDEDLLTIVDQPIHTKNSLGGKANTSIDATESTSTDVSSLYNTNQDNNNDIYHDLNHPIVTGTSSSGDKVDSGDNYDDPMSNLQNTEEVLQEEENTILKDTTRSNNSSTRGSTASVIHVGYGSDEQHILDGDDDTDWAESIAGTINDFDGEDYQDATTSNYVASDHHHVNLADPESHGQNENHVDPAAILQYYPSTAPLHQQQQDSEQNNSRNMSYQQSQQQKQPVGNNNDSIDSIFTNVDTILMNSSLKIVQRRIHEKNEDMDIAILSSSSSYSSTVNYRNPNEFHHSTGQGSPRIVPVLSLSMKNKNNTAQINSIKQGEKSQSRQGTALARAVMDDRYNQENKYQSDALLQLSGDINTSLSPQQSGSSANRDSEMLLFGSSMTAHLNTVVSGLPKVESIGVDVTDSGYSDSIATGGEVNTATCPITSQNTMSASGDDNVTASSESNNDNTFVPVVTRTYVTDPRDFKGSFTLIQNLYSGQGGSSSSSSSSSSSDTYSSDNYTATSTDEQSIDLDRSFASGISHEEGINHDGKAKSEASKPSAPGDIV